MRWETRKATISVPTDPRNLFAKETRDRIAAPSPPPLFTYAGSSDRKIIIRRFLQLPSHGQRRSRAFLAYTYVVHTHTVIVCREIIIRHFSPLLYPRQQSQSRPLRRTRVRAGLAACGSHFGARPPGVERYRSVPDRKATGFSPRLIRSFS